MCIDFSQVVTAEAQAQAKAVAEARAFLDATDHEVLKAVEAGKPMPDGMSEARARARAVIKAARES